MLKDSFRILTKAEVPPLFLGIKNSKMAMVMEVVNFMPVYFVIKMKPAEFTKSLLQKSCHTYLSLLCLIFSPPQTIYDYIMAMGKGHGINK